MTAAERCQTVTTRSRRWNPEVIKEISGYYYKILKLLGEDPDREGLLKTPDEGGQGTELPHKGLPAGS